MKSKILAILIAASAAAAMPVASWAGPGNGGGKGGESHGGPGGGSSGHGKGSGKSAGAGFAHGKSRNDVRENGRAFAPGQLKKAALDDDDLSNAGRGRANFGMVISSIRAGKSSLAGVDADTLVNVVDVSSLIRGNNRVALDNALAARADEIDDLRTDLAALGLADLDAATIDDAVAVRKAKDGSLTVFVLED